MIRRLPVLTCAVVMLTAIASARASTIVQGCQIYPDDNAWNRDISGDPIDTANSTNYVNYVNMGKTNLHPDFGSIYGIPFTVVSGSQALVPITVSSKTGYPGESDPGPFPVPLNAPIEGGGAPGGDNHVLVLDKDNALLYELYHGSPTSTGWNCDQSSCFDLKSNALRPDGFTSADAAGLPIFCGLARYDEVAAGKITHALRFTIRAAGPGYIHPATHLTTGAVDPNPPPMGTRFRLNKNFDLTPFHGQALVVLQALKTYGMIVADNGSDWFISGELNPKWDDNDLNQIKTVPGSAFEVVQSGPVLNASGATQPAPTVSNPASLTVAPGATASFSVTATGNATIRYQWKRNGLVINAARTASYTTAPTTIDDDGAKYTCTVTTIGGTVTSSMATLSVTGGSGAGAGNGLGPNGGGTGTGTGIGTGTGTGTATGTSPGALVVTKLSVKLNFSKSDNDQIAFSGTLQIPAAFAPSGQSVTVNVGTIAKTFTLDAKGSYHTGGDSFKLHYKKTKGAIAAQAATYTAKFIKGNFAAGLAGSGLTSTTGTSQVSIAVSTVFLNATSQAIVNKTYMAMAGKFGRTK